MTNPRTVCFQGEARQACLSNILKSMPYVATQKSRQCFRAGVQKPLLRLTLEQRCRCVLILGLMQGSVLYNGLSELFFQVWELECSFSQVPRNGATGCLSGPTGTRSSWKQEGAMQRAYNRQLRPGKPCRAKGGPTVPRGARSWRARAHRRRARQVRASGHTAGNAMRRGFKPTSIAIAC